jgi:hypothetical protein
MNDVLNFLVGLAVLIFLAYVLIFGGIGALVSRHRGGSATVGFIVGLLPIIGWFVVLFLTRAGTREVSADEWLDERSGPSVADWASSEPRAANPVPPPSSDPHDY